VLEANTDYWDPHRLPQVQRIIFDNTLSYDEAIELVKTAEGRVDVVTDLRPLDTLRVAQSPFAKVVKHRQSLQSVFGLINMQKTGSPWHDIRLRQAVNLAINREDLIRYATKGNGVIIPALLPQRSFGYNPDLSPYPFDPTRARHLLHDAGYPQELPVRLIATEELKIQATVVSKMLEQVGCTVDLQILDAATFNTKTFFSELDQPPTHQTWDMALTWWGDWANYSMFEFYHTHALDGYRDWVSESPALRQLFEQALRTVDWEQQQALIRQMERHTQEQAYFLFLYNPIALHAVNKAVEFVPYATTLHQFSETAVSAEHWSVRKQKAAVHE
jgi:peptide/nickel transport system substrate-binding protein